MEIPNLNDFVKCMSDARTVKFEGLDWTVRQVEQLPFDSTPGYTVQIITLTRWEGSTQVVLKLTFRLSKITSTAEMSFLDELDPKVFESMDSKGFESLIK